MSWWQKNNFRMIQFNMEGRDAGMDVDEFIEQCKEFHVNTIMVGAGGMVGFYPSKLEHQYVSPFLGDKDMLGDIIKKAHENNIKVIGRFDISKVHETVAERHPEWLFLSTEGKNVSMEQMVNCCISGEYMSKKAMETLHEVATTYDIDGIFFNFFSYLWAGRDYSGKEHGLCQCDECKKQFKEMFGHDLPKDKTDPHMDELEKFYDINTKKVLDSIHDTIKSVNPNILISTYNDRNIDVMRNESNTHISMPSSIYTSSEHCMTIEGSYPQKTIANCSINAVEIFWRFMGVSKYENALRFYQCLASGSQLDFCIVGTFNNYPETKNFDTVKRIFSYHEENEKYYGNMKSKADIVLVRPANSTYAFWNYEILNEYYGLFKILKEGHYNFDVVLEQCLGEEGVRRDYKLAILPGISPDPSIFAPDTQILATANSFKEKPELMEELFDVKYIKTETQNKGSYAVVSDKETFTSFKDCDWVFVYNDVNVLDAKNSRLEYMPRTKYAPVESANEFKTSGYSLMDIKKQIDRTNTIISFGIGTHYLLYGYTEHRNMVFDLINNVHGVAPIKTNAPDQVEVFYSGCPGGCMVQYVNLTGFNGKTYFKPIAVNNLEVTVPYEGATSVKNLMSGNEAEFEIDGTEMIIKLDNLSDYAALFIS